MPTRKLAISLRRALKLLPPSPIVLPAVLEVNWISAAEMCRIHLQFLADGSLTDVITFPDGEIFICPAVARDEAPAHGHTYEAELLFYAVHAFLHLLGWKDHSLRRRQRMHQEQLRILSACVSDGCNDLTTAQFPNKASRDNRAKTTKSFPGSKSERRAGTAPKKRAMTRE